MTRSRRLVALSAVVSILLLTELCAVVPGACGFTTSSATPSSLRFKVVNLSKGTTALSRRSSAGAIARPNQPISLSSSSTSVEGDFDPDAIAKAKQDIQSGSVKARLRALYKFTRPHTIRGTILGSIAGTVRAMLDTPNVLALARWKYMLPRACVGVLSLLLGNAFIVGINQIYDEDIDKMNKPFLPVASGEMSKRFAWIAVVLSGVVGPLLVNKFFPALLFKLYAMGLFLGLIYSVPPLRTKQNPVLAGLTIAIVRGFLLNFGVYYAVKDVFNIPFTWSPKVSFIARFMTIFAAVIAITKDLPDIEGDKVSAFV
jgi:homogentisate solanesyltransferase